MPESWRAWNPITIQFDAADVTVEVIRLEASTRATPPHGQSVLMLELVVRRAEDGSLIGAWLLTFVHVMAYRMRPVDHPGNPKLTAPSEHAAFWELLHSQYLMEYSGMDKMPHGARWHHYVIRTDLDDTYEVIAQQWECIALPYQDE